MTCFIPLYQDNTTSSLLIEKISERKHIKWEIQETHDFMQLFILSVFLVEGELKDFIIFNLKITYAFLQIESWSDYLRRSLYNCIIGKKLMQVASTVELKYISLEPNIYENSIQINKRTMYLNNNILGTNPNCFY